MDKQAFKQRMQNLKSYRENNPGKGYWDWKVEAFQDGGRHALGVGQVFASLADMLFNKERRTPAMAAAIYNTIHQTQNDPVAAPVEAPITDPISDVITSVDKFPTDPGTVFLLSPENQKKEMAKNSNYRIVDTNSEEDPYGIVRRAANYHKEIHGEVPVYDYIADSDTTIKRSNLMPVGTLPMGDYTPELPHAGSYNSVLYYNAINDKLYQRAYDLNDYGPTDTKDKGASSMYIGPLRWLSRQLDKAGTPFVQRTGFVPFDEEKYYNQLPKSARKKVSEWRRLRNSYEYGGEVDEFQRKTRRDIMQQSLVDGRPNYNKMFQNQNEYQKDFANYWYTERAKNPKYSDQIGGDKLNSVLSNVNKATWKTPTEAMRDNMVGQGYNPTDAQINQQLNILKEKGTKGFANPKSHSYTSLRPANTWHEGIGHMVGDNTPAILNAVPNVRISNPDSSYEDYVNQANEKHAQTWDFRGNNSNLKDDQGNYYIDPNRQLTPEDISNMRSKGAKIPEQWESLKDADISELTNTFAYNLSQDPIYYMASGGEVGDPDDKFAKAVNTKLGRTPDGRPLQQGLKPVFDLEDAANLTPVGDVITTKDIYNSVKESDWSNAGLAALTLLPFVPSGIRNIKAATRYVPSVNKGLDQRMLDNAFNSIKEKREYLSDVANERNRVLESVNGYAHRVRAQKADQMFGTNYNETYDLLSDLYEHHFFDLPEVQAKDMPQIGKMEAKASAKTRYNDTGVGAGPNDFDFLVNVDRPIDAKEIARHEMNHYTDYLISRNPNTTTNNNMLKQLESSLKNTDEKEYFRRGTEQKAYMNQLRARMYEDGAISSLDELVTPSMIKSYIDKLGDKDSIKRAYKQHKSLSSYTKWFNSIPLLGVGAIGVNKYFN